MSNLGLERYLQSIKLSLVRTPVGDRYVLEQMREHGYNVGGEQSGHIILSELHHDRRRLHRRAAVAGGGEEKEQAGVAGLPPLRAAAAGAASNVRYRSGKPLENAKVRSAIADAESRLNGHGRLVVRPSGTEPVIRVMGEGDDKAHGRGSRRRHRRRADRTRGVRLSAHSRVSQCRSRCRGESG